MNKPRKSVHVRRIYPRNRDDIIAEMRALGCHPEGIRIMEPKCRLLLLKIEKLSAPAALIVKQSALSFGGDAAVHRKLISNKVDHTDVLLMLREDQLREFCLKLQQQDFGLHTLSGQLSEFIKDSGDPAAYRSFRVGDQVYSCDRRPYIMGVLNVTPDSFSDGGQYFELDKALHRAREMVEEGADFLDVGGESSRPGALSVSAAEEERRVLPLIEKLARELKIPISVDTAKAQIAQEALRAGARIVNDITALQGDPDMATVIADAQATAVLMHMQGQPRTMQEYPTYTDMLSEIHAFLEERLQFAMDRGIARERLLVDPGIGFGKRLGDNFEILGRLQEFTDLAPVLIGPSRKSFLGKVLDLPVDQRLEGTAAALAVAVLNGANILRVHDVKMAVQVSEITHRCLRFNEPRD
ncbi:MAG: dihydropteroate synthase [bacterium]